MTARFQELMSFFIRFFTLAADKVKPEVDTVTWQCSYSDFCSVAPLGDWVADTMAVLISAVQCRTKLKSTVQYSTGATWWGGPRTVVVLWCAVLFCIILK